MSSRERKEKRKALEQKGVEKRSEVLSKIDIERQKNLSRAQSIQTKKNDLVRGVLIRTNGEFTGGQRRLFELYLFEDRSPEETMFELKLPSDEFYRLVEQTTKKMREHIKNFNF